MNKCPGQDLRFKRPDQVVYDYACGNCGYDIEFWFDDKKRQCSNCGETVQPDLETLMKYHGCSSYCKMAEDCLGHEKYMELLLFEKWHVK